MNRQKIERNLNIMKGNLLFNFIIQIITLGFSIYFLLTMINNIQKYPQLKNLEYKTVIFVLMGILIIIVGIIAAILLYAFINTIKRNPEKIFSIKLASFFLIFTPISYFILSGIFALGTQKLIIVILITLLGLVIGIYNLIFMFTPKSEEIKSFYLENQKIEKIKITNPSEIENITEVQKSIKLFTKIDFEKDKKRTIIIEISQFLFGLLCFAIVLIFGPEDGELTGNFFMIVLFILGAYFSVIKWIYKLINSQNHSFKKIAREQEKWFTSIECQNCHQTDAINLGYYEITCPECQVGFKMIAPQQNSTSNFTPEKTAETSLDNFSQKILSGEQTCVTCKKQITIPEKTIVYNCSHCLTENRISNSTLKTLSQKLSK